MPDIPVHVDRTKRKRNAVSPSYVALNTLGKQLDQLSDMHVVRQASLDNFVGALYGTQASCAFTENASVAGNDCLAVPVASSLCLSKARQHVNTTTLGPLTTTSVHLSALLLLSSLAYRATSLQRPDPSSSIKLLETSWAPAMQRQRIQQQSRRMLRMTPVLLLGQAITATTWKSSQVGQTHLMHDKRDNDSTCSHAALSTPCSQVQMATSPLLGTHIVEVLHQQPKETLKPPPYSMSDTHTAKDNQSKVHNASMLVAGKMTTYIDIRQCTSVTSTEAEPCFAAAKMQQTSCYQCMQTHSLPSIDTTITNTADSSTSALQAFSSTCVYYAPRLPSATPLGQHAIRLCWLIASSVHTVHAKLLTIIQILIPTTHLHVQCSWHQHCHDTHVCSEVIQAVKTLTSDLHMQTRSLAEWELTRKIILQTCKHISFALVGLLIPCAVTVAVLAVHVLALVCSPSGS